jgi:pimeloyl-ACP methyl ester carboxylesterase
MSRHGSRRGTARAGAGHARARQSDRDPAENYDIATYVDDITALLAQLGIGRAVFVGTSMGGLITVELATRHPDLVAGAVINDIGPQLSMVGLARIAGYVGKANLCPTGRPQRTPARP